MLVKGNLPVQFAPGTNSKGTGAKDIIWKLVVRSSKYCLFHVIPCVLGGKTAAQIVETRLISTKST